MKEIYLISGTWNYRVVNDFLVLYIFSWLHFFLLRYDVAVFDLICLLFCIFGSVHLVVLVPDVRSIAVQLSLCPAGYFHRGTLDWPLFIPVPILSRSSSTQWLLCKVRVICETFLEDMTSLWSCLSLQVFFLMPIVVLSKELAAVEEAIYHFNFIDSHSLEGSRKFLQMEVLLEQERGNYCL